MNARNYSLMLSFFSNSPKASQNGTDQQWYCLAVWRRQTALGEKWETLV
jgi:hypothetical protein